MKDYRVLRPFSNGNKLAQKGEKITVPDAVARGLQQMGLITPFYRDKSEKAVKEINNKAYLVHDKGNMFFVKREGEVIGRHTKKKAIEVRDELNAVD